MRPAPILFFPLVALVRIADAADPAITFARHDVDSGALAQVTQGMSVDLDGDGLDDIAGDEENTELITPPRNGIVTWWRNTTMVTLPPGPPPPPPQAACVNPPACAVTVRCEEPARLTLATAACECRAAGAPVCAGEVVVPALERRRARALGRAVRGLRGPRGPSGACRDAMADDLDAARQRVAEVGGGSIGFGSGASVR